MELLTRPTLAELAAADAGASVSLAPDAAGLGRLVTLLSRGAFVRFVAGGSVRTLVVEQFGVSAAYLEKEIKIVFLDSSPVDDLDGTVVRDGATMALSAAMPGLVGMAMRRDGPSWLRASITHHESGEARVVADGVLVLKLFNQVMEDLGERFFARGVYVSAAKLAAFLDRLDDRFWRACPAELGGRPLGPPDLRASLAAHDRLVRLSVPRSPLAATGTGGLRWS